MNSCNKDGLTIPSPHASALSDNADFDARKIAQYIPKADKNTAEQSERARRNWHYFFDQIVGQRRSKVERFQSLVNSLMNHMTAEQKFAGEQSQQFTGDPDLERALSLSKKSYEVE